MKAIAIKEFGGVEKLHIENFPNPNPGENEVLIEITYTAVNPVDWKIREGYLKDRIPHEFPVILGWDASGKVAAIGKNVRNLQVGDKVFAYCRKPTVCWGTYAEYVTFDAANVAKMPEGISFAQAAAIPLAGLTAWQALFDHARLVSGETVLIHAGAGGVGSLAIQFANYAGAKIYTTATEENHAYVKKLGANIPIDYHKENFAVKIRSLEPEGIDVVFDTIGGQTLLDSLKVLKPGGRVVSIVEQVDPKTAEELNLQSSYVFVAPNGEQLARIAELISQGKVVAPDIHEMKLEDAAKAHEKNRQGHTCGKIVLQVKEEGA